MRSSQAKIIETKVYLLPHVSYSIRQNEHF